MRRTTPCLSPWGAGSARCVHISTPPRRWLRCPRAISVAEPPGDPPRIRRVYSGQPNDRGKDETHHRKRRRGPRGPRRATRVPGDRGSGRRHHGSPGRRDSRRHPGAPTGTAGHRGRERRYASVRDTGYDASVDYVVGTLEAAGYEPVVQEFEWDFEETATPEFDLVAPSPPAPKVSSSPPTGSRATSRRWTTSGSGEGRADRADERHRDPAWKPGEHVGQRVRGGGLRRRRLHRGDRPNPARHLRLHREGDERGGRRAVGVIIFNEGQPGRAARCLAPSEPGGHHPRDRDELRGRRGAVRTRPGRRDDRPHLHGDLHGAADDLQRPRGLGRPFSASSSWVPTWTGGRRPGDQ